MSSRCSSLQLDSDTEQSTLFVSAIRDVASGSVESLTLRERGGVVSDRLGRDGGICTRRMRDRVPRYKGLEPELNALNRVLDIIQCGLIERKK